MFTVVFFKSYLSVDMFKLILSSEIIFLNIVSFLNSFTAVRKCEFVVPNHVVRTVVNFLNLFHLKEKELKLKLNIKEKEFSPMTQLPRASQKKEKM